MPTTDRPLIQRLSHWKATYYSGEGLLVNGQSFNASVATYLHTDGMWLASLFTNCETHELGEFASSSEARDAVDAKIAELDAAIIAAQVVAA